MLENLPEELLDLCWQHCDVFDLQALRLASRALSPSASSRLFRNVVLLPTKESAAKCLKLMEHDLHRLSVVTVTLKHDIDEAERDADSDSDSDSGDEESREKGAGDEATDDTTEEDKDEDGVDVELPRLYQQCCRDMMRRFTGLQSVELFFSKNVAAPEPNNFFSAWEKDVYDWETLEYRDMVMKSIVQQLDCSDIALRKLSIINLQNVTVPKTVHSDSFKAVLAGLNTLELQIATESEDGCPENNLNMPELHTFFGQDLSRVWLQPLQTQLTSLTLYADNYWGYFPVCPLGELHFPRLVHLALGNYSFSHDTQLNWILAHGRTLKSLSLDDCPILHHCTMHCGFLDDRRPRNVNDFARVFDREDTWTYDARWHNYFPRIQSGLPKLNDFRIGHGDWRAVDGPMVNRNLLGQELVAGRYIAFHGGTYGLHRISKFGIY